MRRPDLGCNEEFGAPEAASAQTFADLPLVVVHFSSIDVAVAQTQRLLDHTRARAPAQIPGAKPDNGDAADVGAEYRNQSAHSWGRIDLTLRNAGGRRLESFNSFNNAIAWLLSNPLITTVIVIPLRAFACALVLAAFLAPAGATLAQEFNLVIRDHKFEPEEIRVPAGKRVSVYVTNEDATPEEFDSPALKVEKVIPAKSKGLVRIGPLSPGRYEFIGEFHADTAKGVVIAE